MWRGKLVTGYYYIVREILGVQFGENWAIYYWIITFSLDMWETDPDKSLSK